MKDTLHLHKFTFYMTNSCFMTKTHVHVLILVIADKRDFKNKLWYHKTFLQCTLLDLTRKFSKFIMEYLYIITKTTCIRKNLLFVLTSSLFEID